MCLLNLNTAKCLVYCQESTLGMLPEFSCGSAAYNRTRIRIARIILNLFDVFAFKLESADFTIR